MTETTRKFIKTARIGSALATGLLLSACDDLPMRKDGLRPPARIVFSNREFLLQDANGKPLDRIKLPLNVQQIKEVKTLTLISVKGSDYTVVCDAYGNCWVVPN
jgi:hypothetical protein